VGARLSYGRLQVTLGTDRIEILGTYLAEFNGRVKGRLDVELAFHDGRHVPSGRAMAHFAVDPALTEFKGVEFKATAFCISQLTGVANSAIELVTCRRVQAVPRAQIGSQASGWVDDFPEIDPLLVQRGVLDREDVDSG